VKGEQTAMLKLKNITKDYTAGDTIVKALKGIDLEFRKNEFVSILGQSGCGKTTLLNIIGGLDGYTNGDLMINNKSTKDFSDGDWDIYRNHSIGFVFQNYNLIPHQTVLSNVELALTLSGISKSERRERAVKALESVGLGDQLHKKPNQMSGGQMQRVAIARALVNDPEILLADEPTGALDSETSLQIMKILKDISRDRLIIMVTHNPELSEEYSSRIIRLKDGLVINDSNPYKAPEEAILPASKEKKRKKVKKPAMSFKTALGLSLNNLMTKRGRTLLTSFAGSIGIIGIALILSVSTGVQNYIDSVQQDTLSAYPITIESEAMDTSALIETLTGKKDKELEHDRDGVYSGSAMYELINAMNGAGTSKNNLKAFKEYLEKGDNGLSQYISATQYSYDLDLNVYTKDESGNVVKSDMGQLMEKLYGNAGYSSAASGRYSSSFRSMKVWEEMLPGTNGDLTSSVLDDQYDMLYGSWPSSYNEIVLIVDKNNEVSDICLYALGLKSVDDMQDIMESAMNGEQVGLDTQRWSYEDICSMTFKLVPSSSYYQYDSSTGKYTDLSKTETGLNYLFDNGIELKVSGIVRPNEDASASMMNGAIGYTSALTQYVIDQANESDVVKAQLTNKDTDIFSGLPFPAEDEKEPSSSEKAEMIKKYFATLSTSEKASMYTSIASEPTDEYVSSVVSKSMQGMTRENVEKAMMESAQESTGMDQEKLQEYIDSMDDETLFAYVQKLMGEKVKEQYAKGVQSKLGAMTTDQLASAFDAAIPSYTESQLSKLYDEYMPDSYSQATLEDNLKKLGYVDMASPSAINIYANTFEDKDAISNGIKSYNDSVAEEDKITYTDYVALLMSSITTIINAISYVLIAFVAISLVVSSIMIGIITYISVLERTKEIGILRAMGASKKDISRVFNAETLIVGFAAGIIGIGITLALNVVINIILHNLTNIQSLNAVLPVLGGAILIVISMALTFIAGLIPSSIAAKKDPVIALRTE
jgi:putative ABC transport system permease protein